MRLRRLSVTAIMAAVLVGIWPSPLGAQTEATDSTEGGTGFEGSDALRGGGFYLGAGASNDGRTATVDAGSTVRIGDLVPVSGGGEGGTYIGPSGGGGGGGGGGAGGPVAPPPVISCRYEPTGRTDAAGRIEMSVICGGRALGVYDNSYPVWVDPPAPAPAAPGAAPAPVVIDPAILAASARSQLRFPAPVPRSSPGMDVGTYAQLPTAFWLEGWAPVSESATAGPVTATVTARPLRQEWTIRDSVRGTTETVACDGPGEPVATVGEPAGCGWTPVHSSAGQSSTGGSRGEACFETTVTVSWSVSWSSTLGPGGPLGAGTSTTDTCLVVAEIQAIVTDA